MAEQETRKDIPYLDQLMRRVGQLQDYDPARFASGAAEELRETEEKRHQRILGEVEDLLSEGWEVLRGLWNEANPDASPCWDDDWTPACLAVSAWADDSDRYYLQRHRLEKFLETLRSDCDLIDQERLDKICYGDRLPMSDHAWEDLTTKEQKCVQVLLTLRRGEKYSEKQISVKLGYPRESLKRELANLRQRHILGNRKGKGYWVRQIPQGTPHHVEHEIE